jgi:hypothetical protein
MAHMIKKLAWSLAVVVAVVLGVVVFGRLANTDIQAMVLTTLFFGALAVVLLLVVRRRRELLGWLAVPFVLTAGLAGVWLGLPLVTDNTVDEQLVTAPASSSSPAPGAPAESSPQAQENRLVASGEFEAASHPGSGTASIIEKPDGEAVLTFRDFETDNGPDLLVYLVPADSPAGSDEGAVDLGALKGNKGNQQYAVPAGTDLDQDWRVVVWCRAFTVSFTEAPLT